MQLDVRLQEDTLWMPLQMMAEWFQTTVQNIIMHVGNIYQEAELQEEGTIKEILIVRKEGSRSVRRQVHFYNLDMILSVGYRVNTRRGTQFRIWATQCLREYLVRGYIVHEKRRQQLGQVVQLMRRVENRLDARQVLDVIEHYSAGLNLLDAAPELNKELAAMKRCFCINLVLLAFCVLFFIRMLWRLFT